MQGNRRSIAIGYRRPHDQNLNHTASDGLSRVIGARLSNLVEQDPRPGYVLFFFNYTDQKNPKLRRILAVLLIVLSIAASLWINFSAFLDWGLQRLLEQTDLSAPKASGFRLGLEQANLATIEFGADTATGALNAHFQGITATYDLASASLRALDIDHATLKFNYRPSEPAQGRDNARLIRLQRLNIENLELDVETPWGTSRVAGQIQIDHPTDNKLKAMLRDNRHRLVIDLDYDLQAVKAKLDQTKSGEMIAELHSKPLEQSKQKIDIDGKVASMMEWLSSSEWLPTTLRAKAVALNSPLFATATASMQLKFSAETADRFKSIASRIVLTKDGNYRASADINAKHGITNLDAHLDMPATEAFELVKPWLSACNGCQLTNGRVNGTLKFIWPFDQNNSGTARLKVYDAVFGVNSVRLENAYLELIGDDIARKPLEVSLDAPKLAIGDKPMPGNLKIKTRYLDRQLTIEQAALSVFGGTIEVSPDTFDIAHRPIELTLGVHDVDLSQLLNRLNYPALSGSGTLKGKLPLRLDEDTIALVGGSLQGTRSGVLSYQGPVADNNNIAFRALRNLVYHSLHAELNYHPRGDYQLGLRLEGSNPEVLAGHPLAFNLNLSGQLPELLQTGILTGEFERSVLKQASEGRSSAKPR